jgi:hypothetical protein
MEALGEKSREVDAKRHRDGKKFAHIDTGRVPGISSGPGLRFYQLESRL